jgi:hypothetical protein
LLGNAIKFTKSGGVTLAAKPHCRQTQPCIRFDVKDTGIGISKDKQQHIFRSYSQADGTTEHLYGGTGLGLTITKRLTRLLDGDVSVVSEPGRGSVFSIILPLAASLTPDLSASGIERTESQHSKSTEETFDPEKLMALLSELTEELPKTVAAAGADRAGEISDMLVKASALCEDQDRRRQLDALRHYFHSSRSTEQQTRQMILRLEQIFKEIYGCC